jgi:hypothetical protein
MTDSDGSTFSEHTGPREEPEVPIVGTPLIRTMDTVYPDKYKKRNKEYQKAEDK